MTLKEMKVKTLSLIEEYYPSLGNLAEDEDVINKFNGIVNQISMDLMQFRKILATDEITITDDKTIDLTDYSDLYQFKKLVLTPDEDTMDTGYDFIDDTTLKVSDDFTGKVEVVYYKYPKLVQTSFETDAERQAEDESFEFDLDTRLLEVMPYGIAYNLLRLDMISGYGQYFEKTYNEMIQRLDSRKTTGFIYIEGGID